MSTDARPAARHRPRLTIGVAGLVTAVAIGGAVLIGTGSSGSDGAQNPRPAAAATAAVVDQPAITAPNVVAQQAKFAAAHRFPAKEDLNGRAAPALSAKTLKVDAYRKGAGVPVLCQLKGGQAYGSSIWDKTTDGYYVADAYVRTGYSGFVPGLARCTGVPPTQPPTTSTVKGIDISGNQGAGFDLKKEYAAGSRFVFIKATEGSSYVSPAFGKQTSGAIAAGMLHGAYHFANPAGASGAAQAKYFIANGGGWTADGRTLPGVLDIEFNPYSDGKGTCYGISHRATISWIDDFLKTYKKSTGRDAIIYTATSWWKSCTGNTDRFAGTPLWIANYNGSPQPLPSGWSKQLFWQYTSKPIDHNTFYGSLADLQSFARNGSAPTTPPTTPPTTVRKFRTTAELDGRHSKKVSAAAAKTYRNNTTISVKCQAYGDYAYGSPIWDKTTDNLWVPDHYVKTGVDSFVRGLQRCDNDPKPSGPSTAGCLNALGNPRTCAQAVAWATAHVGKVSSDYDHMCDHVTGLAYGHSSSGSRSANTHWANMPAKYKHPGDRTVPAGGLAFFYSSSFGHTMISIGNGTFVSNDIHGAGKLSITTISEIESRWGQRYQGWGQPWYEVNH